MANIDGLPEVRCENGFGKSSTAYLRFGTVQNGIGYLRDGEIVRAIIFENRLTRDFPKASEKRIWAGDKVRSWTVDDHGEWRDITSEIDLDDGWKLFI